MIDFDHWCAAIATAPPDEKAVVFQQLAFDVGADIAGNGIDRPDAIDRLFNIACGYDWFGVGEEGIQRIVVEQFHAADAGEPEQQSEAPPEDDEAAEPPATSDGSALGFAWTLLMLGEEVTDVMRNWLVDKMLPQAGVGLIAGQWGLFKTFCACDLSAAVMRGGQFIGFPIARPGGVFLLATEGQSEVNVRMSAAWQAHGGNGRPPFIWVNKAPPLLGNHAADILIAMISHAKAKLQRDHGVGLSLVLIDALGKAAGYTKAGDENDASLAKRINKALNDAALATDVLILGVTHFGKHVETGTRGSSAFEDDADVVLALIGDRTIGGQVSNTRLCLRKLRGGQSGDEFPFQTRGVVVGSENTLVINWRGSEEPTAAPKAKADAWAKKSLRLLRQALMNTLVDCGKDIRPWADGPVVRAVDLEVVRDQFYKGHPAAEATDAAGKKSARQKAFKRAVEDARTGNLIGSWEIEGVTYVWLIAPSPTQGEMPL